MNRAASSDQGVMGLEGTLRVGGGNICSGVRVSPAHAGGTDPKLLRIGTVPAQGLPWPGQVSEGFK